MGILVTLDCHKTLQSGEKEDFEEVEYQLQSWGEIFPPFLGNREHSLEARFILRDFPFKLFSSSTPYDDPLPQKLCLTFKAPWEHKWPRKDTMHSGVFSDETAEEFAAFLSVVTRRRVFTSKKIRSNGLPIEQDIGLYQRVHFQERQRLKEINPKDIYQLLENLQVMDRTIAGAFILALRFYHSAVEMMYTQPEFSYLFLVTCLETISLVFYSNHRPKEEEFLNSRYGGWRDLSKNLPTEWKPKLKELLLRNERFTFNKLSKFTQEYVPDHFWSETVDDAKPDYLTRKSGLGRDGLGYEQISHSDPTIRQWEKIEKENLIQVLRDIYKARSQLIHKGVRFPASIVLGHCREVPPEASAEIMHLVDVSYPKYTLRIPTLLTFERLVSYCLVEFLRSPKTQE